MKQYELETGTLGFLGIDKEAFSIRVVDNNIVYDTLERYSKLNLNPKSVPIPDGFKPLSLFSQLKEEDVKEVMPTKRSGRSVLYEDFNKSSLDHCAYALQSIHSLAQHFGLDTTQPIFVIFKPR